MEGVLRAGPGEGRTLNSELERILAFWVAFAEVWKNLAAHSHTDRGRREYLKRAKACLFRAKVIRERIETAQQNPEVNQLDAPSATTIVS